MTKKLSKLTSKFSNTSKASNAIHIIKAKLTKKNKPSHSSKRVSSKSTQSQEQYINNLIASGELKDPSTLRIGHVTQEFNGIRYIVKKKQGLKYYTVANNEEIACNTLLKENMGKYISIYIKTKGKHPFKTYNSAVSFALKQTRLKYPKCLMVNSKYNIDKENQSVFTTFLDNIKYYSKYGYYKFINLF
jgi:hypothetical protein